MKSTITTQKLNHDESLQQEKLRIKNEEEKKQHELEDRLRSLIITKDDLEVMNCLKNFDFILFILIFSSRVTINN